MIITYNYRIRIMNRLSWILLSLIIATIIVLCPHTSVQADEQLPGKTPGICPSAMGKTPEAIAGMFKGKVVETINAGRYAYVQINTGEKSVWVAVPDFDGKPGDTVLVPPGVPMANFHSKKLNRDFEMIYFVGGIRREGEGAEGGATNTLPQGASPMTAPVQNPTIHPPMEELSDKPAIEIGKVEKAKGGQTVSEIIADRKNLTGKEIMLRARVVKFTPNIMGKNWVHVQDGSGKEGMNDLIVTTNAVIKVGDLALIRGIVKTDVNLGLGLTYAVVVENADVMVEQEP
jgi:hypothetical protein